jgi:hypothetical protein
VTAPPVEVITADTPIPWLALAALFNVIELVAKIALFNVIPIEPVASEAILLVVALIKPVTGVQFVPVHP